LGQRPRALFGVVLDAAAPVVGRQSSVPPPPLTTDDRRSTTDDRRSTTDDRRSTTDDRRLTTDDRRLTTDDRNGALCDHTRRNGDELAGKARGPGARSGLTGVRGCSCRAI